MTYNRPTKMTASEAFVEQMVAEGVSLVPGIVGSAFMDALDLFPTAGIRFLPWRTSKMPLTWLMVTPGYAMSRRS